MKIKTSKRGLTFSFRESEKFQPGEHYRYVVDNTTSEVYIIPDEDGKYIFSKKGKDKKPLVDLRNKEIREAMSLARYMEVEILDDRIVVHIIKTDVNICNMTDPEIKDLIDRTDEVTFSIDKKELFHHHEALSEMLTISGMFSESVSNDISYVFDVGSFFSGSGMRDYPYKKDDAFNIVFATDYEEDMCETYRYNIGSEIRCMDIRNLQATDVPSIDVMLGSPSCKPFSNANRHKLTKEMKDERLLICDFVRMVKAKKPLIFSVENVEGFLTAERGLFLNILLDELSYDYNITYSVLRDSDLGGYSDRKRMLLMGSIKSMGKIIIPDVEITSGNVADALNKVNSEWYNYKDISKSHAGTKKIMDAVPDGGNWKNIPVELRKFGENTHSNIFRRLKWDETSVSLANWRKSMIMPPHGTELGDNRILSVAEAASIMGLDKAFRFLGKLSSRQQMVANGCTQAFANFEKDIIKNALFKYFNRIFIPSNAA